jgi:hypothetical protein
VNGIEELLLRAARDDCGELILRRVQGRTGQWFVMPLDPDGLPLTFWAPSDSRFSEDAFCDEEGNVLMGVVFMYYGLYRTTTPLDASLRPTISVVALVHNGETVSPNPGGWPLTEEELDREEPPPDPPNLPEWQREAMASVARDGLGQPLTTRIRAADGGWADILMTRSGEPLRFDLDLGMAAGHEPRGETKRMTLMRALGGLVAITLDEQGRPEHSPAGVCALQGAGSEEE